MNKRSVPPVRRSRQSRISPRTLQKQETRERILQAAAAIARREGLQAASIPRVMRTAGLTIGGFYGHFASKTALDAEVIRSVLGAIPGRGLQGLDRYSGLEWVARATTRYLTPAHRDNPDGCGYPAILSGVATGHEDAKAALAAALDLRVKSFEAHVPALSSVTARERSLALMALTMGGLLLARACGPSSISDEVLSACKKWALPELDNRAGWSK